jgi:hypothetical protein
LRRLTRLWDSLRRGARFVRTQGPLAAVRRIRADRLPFSPVPDFAYREWLRTESQPELGRSGPLLDCVSLLVPLHASKRENVAELYESVRAQSHSNWQLCFGVDGTLASETDALLRQICSRDERVIVVESKGEPGISAATNAALHASRGSLIGLLDHDDLLSPCVLELAARSFRDDPELDLLYTDEDVLSAAGERRSPLLKPGMSPILLLGTNYVMHLVVLRRALVEDLGGLRSDFDGAQDHDLLLRGFEVARRVRHLPWIGYHWRAGETSVASGSAAKPWAYERGRNAVAEACVRRGIPVRQVAESAIPGLYGLELAPLPRALAIHVVLHGGGPACDRWRRALKNPPDEVQVRGITVGYWPARVGDDEHVLVVDARVVPNAQALVELARWSAAPGIGAAGSMGRGRWLPAATGFGISTSGHAHPLPAITLHARLPHEVAAPGTGLLLLVRPDPALLKLLEGQRFARVDAVCMSLGAWLDKRRAVFVPIPYLRPSMEEPLDMATLDLTPSRLWSQIARGLPVDFWAGGADRFGRRHRLLTPLGMPPVPRLEA